MSIVNSNTYVLNKERPLSILLHLQIALLNIDLTKHKLT